MISKKMIESLKGGSEIRKMFEEGGRLKAIYGAENVYDFSIGNPDLEPPKEVFDALKDLANNPTPGMHGYMPNAGYPSTRQIVAEKRGKEVYYRLVCPCSRTFIECVNEKLKGSEE